MSVLKSPRSPWASLPPVIHLYIYTPNVFVPISSFTHLLFSSYLLYGLFSPESIYTRTLLAHLPIHCILASRPFYLSYRNWSSYCILSRVHVM